MIDGFIVDFYCNLVKLIVEVDGKIHETIREYDHEREIILQAKGFKIIRFTNEEIDNNLEAVLQGILANCHQKYLDSSGYGYPST